MFNDVYRGKRVLITGNTGFKGSWLALFLQKAGAEIHGYALPPEGMHNHFQLLNLQYNSTFADIKGVFKSGEERSIENNAGILRIIPLERGLFGIKTVACFWRRNENQL